ncbi:MAG: hypothetical protein KJ063_25090 [Anaerolineae bacterium]|nr:hypothetical protein [Anaerolineae bacterium]
MGTPAAAASGRPRRSRANLRGVLDGPTGQVSGQLAAHFYDNQGNLLAIDLIWQVSDYNQPTTPQTHSGSAFFAAHLDQTSRW